VKPKKTKPKLEIKVDDDPLRGGTGGWAEEEFDII
jgi:hypothetical protein